MKSSLTRTRWAAIGAAVAVSLGGGVVMVANAAQETNQSLRFSGTGTNSLGFNYSEVSTNVFQPVEPCRLLDTRSGEFEGRDGNTDKYHRGIRLGKIGGTTSGNNNVFVPFDPYYNGRDYPEDQNFADPDLDDSYDEPYLGDCDGVIEEGRTPTAISVIVTVVNTSNSGYMNLYPASGGTPPLASHLLFDGGFPDMNGSDVEIGVVSSGTYSGRRGIKVYIEETKSKVDVVIDVLGYYYDQQVVSDIQPYLDIS